MNVSRSLVSGCLVLTACASPTLTPQRLPTRAPTAQPTAVEMSTPFAISAEDYYSHGVERQRVGDVNGALQHLTWAIQRDPRLASAYVARGSVYLAREDGERALSDADAALGIEPSAEAFLLRGEALRLLGRHQEALEAFDGAKEQNPDLRSDTFNSRWWAAREAGDLNRLEALRDEYAAAHPDDPLCNYYRGWVAIESGATMEAVLLLVDGIQGASRQPALLWYALGRAYAEEGAWQQAIRALETARALLEAGDATLGLHTERPVADLFVMLGEAYLGAGRCADAGITLAYAGSVGAPASAYMPALQKAQVCVTPAPTASP